MLALWLVKNAGFIFLAVSIFGFIILITKAWIRNRLEAKAEAEAAAEKAAKERAKKQEAARAAAEKAAQEAARKAAEAEAKAARKAAQETARAEKTAAREAREAAAARKTAEKLETARKLAEYRERQAAAAQALRLAEAAPVPGRAPEASAAPDPLPDPLPDNAPKPFAGQIVSFTGRLKSMNRAEAAEMVKQAGGKAFTKAMPAGTTILVIGDTNGENTAKQDKAAEWIGQVRRITEAQFLAMFK